jgi:hypothetical protein
LRRRDFFLTVGLGSFYEEGNVRSAKPTALTRIPRSGDALVDWIFKQFVFFLRKETIRIKRKRYVFDSDDPHRKALRGIIEPRDDPGHKLDIMISAAKNTHCNRDEEVETLIHELAHVVCWKIRERFIRQVEDILTDRFTVEQKNYLKSFIPRHEVKSV